VTDTPPGTGDDVSALLAESQRIADGRAAATRILGMTPDFTACGGPAAEAYWEHFTPARISSLLAAIRAALKLTRDSAGSDRHPERVLTVGQLREAITRELSGDGTAREGDEEKGTGDDLTAILDLGIETLPLEPAPAEPPGLPITRTPFKPSGDEPVAELHADLLERAWGVIANAGWNAGTGNADLPKTGGWHETASRWRDDYHRWLDLHLQPGGYQTWEQLAAGLRRERDALAYEVTQLRRQLRDAVTAMPAVRDPDA
jgi:hypothetical protein